MTKHEAQRIVLGALLEARPGPLSRPELAAMVGDPSTPKDAVGALQRDGVANVEGSLVFPVEPP